jgi:predicted ATP-dependent endonuclease of OLD family
MKLKEFQVTEFQSVLDSGPISVGDVTCLVGKNEAGKTAILKALYKLNPIRLEDANFNVTDDFPRMEVNNYEVDVANGRREPAPVIKATYELEGDEIKKVVEVFGDKFLKSNTMAITKYYSNTRTYTLSVDESEAIKFMARNLSAELQKQAIACKSSNELAELLEPHESEPAVAAIIEILRVSKNNSFSWYAYNKIIYKHEPKYLYFDEYYQMRGCENIEALQQRVANGTLKPSDQPLLGLIDLARLNLGQLINPERTQDLKNKLEGAGNYLTRQILRFWSQNKHLQMRFDVRPALPGDPEDMREGTNIWGEVYDTRHYVSTSLGSRSRGFVWFFSFVAWYSQVNRRGDNVILLLDEPGLTLHGRAQGDLLRYFETELKPNHQVIYSTHSPFMVDPEHFERVRIIQDLSIDKDDVPEDQQGTRVVHEIFEATDDSLFPLQGALGYDIHQTLFVGPNTLLVEGAADLLFIQGMSALLEREDREGLSAKWTVTPVGGSSRIPTFVRLLTNQRGMRIATLIDIQSKDRPVVENLYKDKLLKQSNVRTFGDYIGTTEADIEDMFEPDFYLNIVNQEYTAVLKKPLKLTDFASKAPRILRRIEEHLETNPLTKGTFSHYRPARYFHEKLDTLAKGISAQTKDRFEKAFNDLNSLLPQ